MIAGAWRLYRARFWPLVALFAGLGIVTLVPSALILGVSGPIVAVYLLLQVVFPAVLASAAFAVAAVVLDEHRRERRAGLREAFARLGPRAKEVVAAGLLSGMISLALVVFLRQWGLLLLPLAFGPPILIQVVALEKASLQEASSRAGSITKGSTGRVISYLVSISLALALLNLVFLVTVVGLVQRTIPTAAETAARFAYGILQVSIVAVTIPYLAAASYLCYVQLAAQRDSVEEGPSGIDRPEALPDA